MKKRRNKKHQETVRKDMDGTTQLDGLDLVRHQRTLPKKKLKQRPKQRRKKLNSGQKLRLKKLNLRQKLKQRKQNSKRKLRLKR